MEVPTTITIEDSVFRSGVYHHATPSRALIDTDTRRTTLRRHIARHYTDAGLLANKLRTATALIVVASIVARCIVG